MLDKKLDNQLGTHDENSRPCNSEQVGSVPVHKRNISDINPLLPAGYQSFFDSVTAPATDTIQNASIEENSINNIWQTPVAETVEKSLAWQEISGLEKISSTADLPNYSPEISNSANEEFIVPDASIDKAPVSLSQEQISPCPESTEIQVSLDKFIDENGKVWFRANQISSNNSEKSLWRSADGGERLASLKLLPDGSLLVDDADGFSTRHDRQGNLLDRKEARSNSHRLVQLARLFGRVDQDGNDKLSTTEIECALNDESLSREDRATLLAIRNNEIDTETSAPSDASGLAESGNWHRGSARPISPSGNKFVNTRTRLGALQARNTNPPQYSKRSYIRASGTGSNQIIQPSQNRELELSKLIKNGRVKISREEEKKLLDIHRLFESAAHSGNISNGSMLEQAARRLPIDAHLRQAQLIISSRLKEAEALNQQLAGNFEFGLNRVSFRQWMLELIEYCQTSMFSKELEHAAVLSELEMHGVSPFPAEKQLGPSGVPAHLEYDQIFWACLSATVHANPELIKSAIRSSDNLAYFISFPGAVNHPVRVLQPSHLDISRFADSEIEGIWGLLLYEAQKYIRGSVDKESSKASEFTLPARILQLLTGRASQIIRLDNISGTELQAIILDTLNKNLPLVISRIPGHRAGRNAHIVDARLMKNELESHSYALVGWDARSGKAILLAPATSSSAARKLAITCQDLSNQFSFLLRS
jgi:hypothetical protein